MVHRQIKISPENSFFLFGARGTGKSTLLENLPFLKDAFAVDLLDQDSEEEYSLRPQLLYERCEKLKPGTWVSIDEIQKNARLLNVVHQLIEKRKLKFALTGSSSRKLKRSGANLLAGRAHLYTLHPLTSFELGKEFDLDLTLNWGSLPKLFEYKSDRLREKFLKSYVNTYLKEEVVAEQLVRKLDPFRLFLPIAAQMNGEPLNFTNISRDTGVDYKTIQTYFEILTETYIGSFLESYAGSVRKVQIQAPKFYLFDAGVKRALQKQTTVSLVKRSSDYGKAFENFFINECFASNAYKDLDYSFSYLRTKDDVEIDLIITRPNGVQSLIEIKSSDKIDDRDLRHLLGFKKDFPKAQLICASQVKVSQKIQGVWVLPWREALTELGLT